MRIAIASTIRSRLFGLLGKKAFEGALLLTPCKDIHTFGMEAPLDVAFVDMYGLVLESYRNVAPCKRIRCKRACATLERFASDGTWFARGDRLSLGFGKEGEGHENMSGMSCSDVR